MDWLIRYKDGSEFSSEDGAAWEAPRTQVMAVLQRDPIVDVAVLRSGPGLWVWKGEWVALQSDWALWDYLALHDGPCTVLRGEMLAEHLWRDKQAMYEDTAAMFGTGKTLFKAGLPEGLREHELLEELG